MENIVKCVYENDNLTEFLYPQLLHSLDGDDHSISTHTANLNLHTPRASKANSHQTSPGEPTQLVNPAVST